MRNNTNRSRGYFVIVVFLVLAAILLFNGFIWAKYVLLGAAIVFGLMGFLNVASSVNHKKGIEYKDIKDANDSQLVIGQEVAVDLITANKYALVSLIPFLLVFGSVFYFTWQNRGLAENLKELLNGEGPFIFSKPLVVILIVIAGIILHELLHGLIFIIYSKKGFRSVKFGIMWETFSPYCHGKEPLRVWQYRLGTILPGIILGLVPVVTSIFIGHIPLFAFGILFSISAMGDFLIIWMLRNYQSGQLVKDHPEKVGFYIFIDDKKQQ